MGGGGGMGGGGMGGNLQDFFRMNLSRHIYQFTIFNFNK
jgi:hypothetical protein